MLRPCTISRSVPFLRLHRCRRHSATKRTVTAQQTRLAYADTIGEERLSGKVLGLGPILQWLDNFGGSVAENAIASKVAMAAVEQIEVVSPISHGDVVRFEGEVINIGRSSLTVQVTGYRHDILTRKFVHAVDAVMTAVALDENSRPCRDLPQLVFLDNESYGSKLKYVAGRRKDLSTRFRDVDESVDQLRHVFKDMLGPTRSDECLEMIPVANTVVALANSFLPRHLNRNGTVFGGEILSLMDKTATYCGQIFTGNNNVVTVSADHISFKLPVEPNDVVTVEARVCDVRDHIVGVEVQSFLKKFASHDRQQSHVGYFSVANLDASGRAKRVIQGLKIDEDDQPTLRRLLKAQRRRQIREQEKELLQLEPLNLSPVAESRL